MSGYIGNAPVPQATQTRQTFTATSGQTSFATAGYTPQFLDLFMNGIHLINGTDYTAANGSDVILTTGAAAGDLIEVIAYSTFDTANVTGADVFTVTGSFTSQGIDDNATSTAMTLDSSGNVLAGTTGTADNNANGHLFYANGTAHHSRNGDAALRLYRPDSGGNIAQFRQGANLVGTISVTSSGTTYSTTSDRRLKGNIQPIADATDKLMAMKPVTHTWIADPEADAVHGFIAQEMQEIVPEAVTGDPDGEEMMSMDYGRITPVLVAALQEATNEIKALKERVSELEGK